MTQSALTALLLSHRANHTTIAEFDTALVPTDTAAAYAIQNETIAALGQVGAWKVTPMPAEGVPFCSPLPKSVVYDTGVALKRSELAGLSIEVEVAVMFDKDLPAKEGGYTPAEIHASLRSVHIALELLSSRYVDRGAVPKLAGMADLQSNGGVIVGPAVAPATLPEFAEQAMTLKFDGAEVQSTTGDASTDNVLTTLAWLAGHAAERGLPLKAGDVVITGARLGPVDFSGTEAVADAPGLGTVRFTLT